MLNNIAPNFGAEEQSDALSGNLDQFQENIIKAAAKLNELVEFGYSMEEKEQHLKHENPEYDKRSIKISMGGEEGALLMTPLLVFMERADHRKKICKVELINAIESNDINKIKKLLQEDKTLVNWILKFDDSLVDPLDAVGNLIKKHRVYGADDFTLLFFAIQQGNPEIVQLLLENGADVNYQSPCFGFTPLMWAVDKLDAEDKCDVQQKIIQNLLKAKDVDIDLKAKNNETALDIAKRLGNIYVREEFSNSAKEEGKDKKKDNRLVEIIDFEIATLKVSIRDLAEKEKGASSQEDKELRELKKKESILQRFNESITKQKDSSSFTLREIYLIKDLLPGNIKAYEAFLPQKINWVKHAKNIENIINMENILKYFDAKDSIEELGFSTEGFSDARKNYLLSLFPKQEDILSQNVVFEDGQKNKIIANLYVNYFSIREHNNKLSAILEKALIETLDIPNDKYQKALKSRNGIGRFFRGAGKAKDPVGKLIALSLKANSASKEILPVAQAVLNNAHSIMRFLPPVPKGKEIPMHFLSASIKNKKLSINEGISEKNFSHLEYQVKIATNDSLKDDKYLQILQTFKNEMSAYLPRSSTKEIAYDRQTRARYLGNLVMEKMDEYVDNILKNPTAKSTELNTDLSALALELYVHYESIIKHSKSSRMAKSLEKCLVGLLGIDMSARPINYPVKDVAHSIKSIIENRPEAKILFNNKPDNESISNDMDKLTQKESSYKSYKRLQQYQAFENIGKRIVEALKSKKLENIEDKAGNNPRPSPAP